MSKRRPTAYITFNPRIEASFGNKVFTINGGGDCGDTGAINGLSLARD